MTENENTFLLSFLDFRKDIFLFELAQVSATCTSVKCSKKNKMSVKH